MINLKQTNYINSAYFLHQLPEDLGSEVAFAGRSNVGKSSAINALTNTKLLAHTSKTPGRTQTINSYSICELKRLVDLPGYGYAKVSKKIHSHWQKNITNYILNRQSLKALILLIDIRHLLKSQDLQLIKLFSVRNIPVHIVLTKSDKLNKSKTKQSYTQTYQSTKEFINPISVQVFSALNKQGIGELSKQIEILLSI